MLKVFIGYDPRQPISYNVLQHSILHRSSRPVSIIPLVIEQLPTERQGLTPFTYTRFLTPYLCDYEGWALFLDADILLLDDISKLFDFADEEYAIMVAKNSMQFEWASVMLFNCGHEVNKVLTPEFVNQDGDMHRIGWLDDELIGSFPSEWNHLVGYDKPRDDAKLVHYTQGVPAFPETNTCEYSKQWGEELQKCNSAIHWEQLMGNSVHAITVNGKKMPKFLIDEEKQAPAEGFEDKVKELLTGGS